MSTYYPKTLKSWKAHKRSLENLYQSPRQNSNTFPPHPPSSQKLQIIHSLDADPQAISPPRLPQRQRYKLQENRSKSTHLSSGFKKLRKQGTRLAFSKVVSEQHFIRVQIGSKSIQQGNTAGSYLPKMRMIPKNKRLLLIRNQVRRKPLSNNILQDLLQVKQPINMQLNEVLRTDEEKFSLHLLQEESFSPYRLPKNNKNDESSPHLHRSIHQMPNLPEKELTYQREDLTSESIPNFMSINEIGLKEKNNKKKGKSLSLMDLKMGRKKKEQQSIRRYSKRANFQIESWQIEKW